LCLYDVTSSYFEGQKNELAAPGYNRDGKRFKKQVVIGLMTDDQGEPVAIRVFKGNTADPSTLAVAVEALVSKLGIREIVFVGDRGMVKSKGKEVLSAAQLRWITALTDPQVRLLLKKGNLQMDLFEETPVEVSVGDRRLILRLNPDRVARDAQRRANQIEKVRAKLEQRNQLVAQKKRASPEASLKLARTLLKTYRLHRFVEPCLEGRQVVLRIDEAKRKEVALLDGCYVIETNVPKDAMDKDTVHARYKDLARVERDFRTMKTTLLELRPIFLRKAARTRAHAFVTMLALKLARRIEEKVHPLGLTVEDALERLKGVRLVSLGLPRGNLWRLPTYYAAAQQEILKVLPPLPPPMLSLTQGHHFKNGRTRNPK
jgi:transposase